MNNKDIRVNIKISKDTKTFFEELSKEVGAAQSALMAIALKEYIDQKKAIKEIPYILKKLEEISNKGDRENATKNIWHKRNNKARLETR